MGDLFPFRRIGEVADEIVDHLRSPRSYAARGDKVVHLDALGAVDEVLDIREAISRHADEHDRSRRLRLAGLHLCAQHSQDIANEIEEAITEAQRPVGTFDIATVTAMAAYPIEPCCDALCDAYPIKIKVGDRWVRVTLGDIRKAKASDQ